jgi:hypothetical protein
MKHSYMPISGWVIRVITPTVEFIKAVENRASLRVAVNFSYEHADGELRHSMQGEALVNPTALKYALANADIAVAPAVIPAHRAEYVSGVVTLSRMFEFTVQEGGLSIKLSPGGKTVDGKWTLCVPAVSVPTLKLSVNRFTINHYKTPETTVDVDTGEVIPKPTPTMTDLSDLNW